MKFDLDPYAGVIRSDDRPIAADLVDYRCPPRRYPPPRRVAVNDTDSAINNKHLGLFAARESDDVSLNGVLEISRATVRRSLCRRRRRSKIDDQEHTRRLPSLRQAPKPSDA